jgi:hypothetical protein
MAQRASASSPFIQLAQSPELACAQPQYSPDGPKEKAHSAAAPVLHLPHTPPQSQEVRRRDIPPAAAAAAAVKPVCKIPERVRVEFTTIDDTMLKQLLSSGKGKGYSSIQVLEAFAEICNVTYINLRTNALVSNGELHAFFEALKRSPSWPKISIITLVNQPLQKGLDLTGATGLTALNVQYCHELKTPFVLARCSNLEVFLQERCEALTTAPLFTDCTRLLRVQFWHSPLAQLPNLDSSRHTLESILLEGCAEVTELELKGLTKLTHLFLKKCPKLSTLTLEGCDLVKHIDHDPRLQIIRQPNQQAAIS